MNTKNTCKEITAPVLTVQEQQSNNVTIFCCDECAIVGVPCVPDVEKRVMQVNRKKL